MKNPSLLDDDGQYFYNEDDFMSEFHRVVFGCIRNLYLMGAKKVTTLDIENYLKIKKVDKVLILFNDSFLEVNDFMLKWGDK